MPETLKQIEGVDVADRAVIKEQLNRAGSGSYPFLYTIGKDSKDIREIPFLKALFLTYDTSDVDFSGLLTIYLGLQRLDNRSYFEIFKEQLGISDEDSRELEELILKTERNKQIYSMSDEIKKAMMAKIHGISLLPSDDDNSEDLESTNEFERYSKVISRGFTAFIDIGDIENGQISARSLLKEIVSNEKLSSQQIIQLVTQFLDERRMKEGSYSDILKKYVGTSYDNIAFIAEQAGGRIPMEVIANKLPDIPKGLAFGVAYYLRRVAAKEAEIKTLQREEDENINRAIEDEVQKVLDESRGEESVKAEEEPIREDAPVMESDESPKPKSLSEFVENAIVNGQFTYRDEVVHLIQDDDPTRAKFLLSLIISPEMVKNNGGEKLSYDDIRHLAIKCINTMTDAGFEGERIAGGLDLIIRKLDERFVLEEDDDLLHDLLDLRGMAEGFIKKLRDDGIKPVLRPGSFKRPPVITGFKREPQLNKGRIAGVTLFIAGLIAALLFGLKDKKRKDDIEIVKGQTKIAGVLKPSSNQALESKEVETPLKLKIVLSESFIDGSIIINKLQTQMLLSTNGWAVDEFGDGVLFVTREDDGKKAKIDIPNLEKSALIGEVEIDGEWIK